MTGKIPKKNPRPGVDEYGRTKLHNAVADGNLLEVQNLIAQRLALDIQDDNGMTPLHFAVQNKRSEIFELLLAHKANPNMYDRHGNGPLWVAVLNSKDTFNYVEKLLANGAEPDHKNAYGKSPKDLAFTIKHGLEEIFGI